MKKFRTALSVVLVIFTFIASIYTFPVQAEDTLPVQEEEQPTERIGSYFYDVASGTETFIPATNDVAIASQQEIESEQNTASFVPPGLSVDPPSDVQPDTIFNDNWQPINPATGGQYRNTVYLDIATNNGRYRGTGFMIGPNTVATCGHCIYSTEYGSGRWATSVTVTPAKAGSSSPYGQAISTSYEVGGNWANNEDETDDWGIIRLNTNIGNNVGWLGLRWQSNSYNGTSVDVNGYPKLEDSNGNEIKIMYHAWGTVTASYDRMLRSTNINNLGGMSGGPMYIYSSEYGYQAIAFTRGENPNFNAYVRIDEWIFNKFKSYRDLTA